MTLGISHGSAKACETLLVGLALYSTDTVSFGGGTFSDLLSTTKRLTMEPTPFVVTDELL